MTAEDHVNQLIGKSTQAQGELMKGNPQPVDELCSYRQGVTLANPLALSYVGGSRLLRLPISPHRWFEMARLSALKRIEVCNS
ncbi:MAG TPA: hypothetical protein VE462_11785 [Propionibacteriaceae bacterium]|nr:hypothetical protein [Propionibacteriaceae bacterium]